MKADRSMDDYRLMIPGPIQLSPEVLREMARPIVPHFGVEWTSYYNETINLLRKVFKTSGSVYAIPGSGSASLEAAISSCISPDDRILILSNGWFGERLVAIAHGHTKNVSVAHLAETKPISPDDLEQALSECEDVRAVAVVHSESSSGLLNPVRKLSEICRQRGILFLVDAISSLGGIELEMDEWGIDLCVTASQKCLEGPPGLGLVAVGDRAWSEICDVPSRGWYLNLHVWHEFAEDWSHWHPYPITMAVPAFRALRRGLEIILDEGLDQRILRHREMATSVRERLSSLGFEPVFDDAIASPTVIAVKGQEALQADEVIDRLKSEHRILVAGGMGVFKGRAFRIGNMGPQATPDEMDHLLDAITSLVRKTDGKGRE